MGTLDHLVNILQQLQKHAALIGTTLAALMIAIYCITIMLSHDTSAMASRNKWDGLQKVLICAGIITGTFAFMQFAEGLGKML